MFKQNKNQQILAFIICGMILLPLKESFLFAQNTSENIISDSNTVNITSESPSPPPSSSTQNSEIQLTDEEQILENKKQKTSNFFYQIQSEIASNEREALAINRNVSETEDKLKITQGKVNTLNEQLKNLDNQIQLSTTMIENVSDQIQRKETEIKNLYYEIDLKKTEISFQKQMLLEYIQMLYKQQNSVSNIENFEQQMSSIELLLGDETAGEALKAIRYSEVLEETGRNIFDKLQKLMDEQKANQQVLEVKKRNLSLLADQLQKQKDQLDVQRKAKAALLEQTQGQEKIYQELLTESKRQQAQVFEEIEALRKNLAFIQNKMKTLGDKFNPDDYKNLIQDNTKAIYNYLGTAGSNNEEFSLRWPVSPTRGISAYFRDQDYVKVIGMQHDAIDIPTPQSTPVKAPADGIVYKAKDNGYGYSYIILAHGNGFMSVYGHISEIRVKVGDIIKTGEVIGLSGATPGTRGAGLYTTGPHLHFEVLKGGKYQDPLNYLNLAYLPFERLPEKYVARAMGDRAKVKRLKEEEDVAVSGDYFSQQIEINGMVEKAQKIKR